MFLCLFLQNHPCETHVPLLWDMRLTYMGYVYHYGETTNTICCFTKNKRM